MADLKEETRNRLAEWKEQLEAAITETEATAERERIQRELMELDTRRQQLDALNPEQLKTLHEHLQRDPREWVRHGGAG